MDSSTSTYLDNTTRMCYIINKCDHLNYAQILHFEATCVLVAMLLHPIYQITRAYGGDTLGPLAQDGYMWECMALVDC